MPRAGLDLTTLARPRRAGPPHTSACGRRARRAMRMTATPGSPPRGPRPRHGYAARGRRRCVTAGMASVAAKWMAAAGPSGVRRRWDWGGTATPAACARCPKRLVGDKRQMTCGRPAASAAPVVPMPTWSHDRGHAGGTAIVRGLVELVAGVWQVGGLDAAPGRRPARRVPRPAGPPGPRCGRGAADRCRPCCRTRCTPARHRPPETRPAPGMAPNQARRARHPLSGTAR